MLTDDRPPSQRHAGLGVLALLAVFGAGTVVGTSALSNARDHVADSIEPELDEALAVTESYVSAVHSDDLVVVGHPHLPARLTGIEDELLASRMLFHPDVVAEVERWTGYWSSNLAPYVPLYLSRMTAFESVVDSTLSSRDLPWSLRFLPVIESGYNPTAVSSASAVGLWQFMEPTARDFDIEVDGYVDGRRDPFLATDAAVRYLEQLHADFDSWFLALAAYNAGPERIRGLMERYLPDEEPSDAVYWALRPVLPKETAEFVPNLLGAIIVGSAPTEYGYDAPAPTSFAYDSVPVVGSIGFRTIAEASGSTIEDIAWLNPQLVREATPSDREILLRLPTGTATAFREYFASRADR
ncbi:MAG: lytic transglycosylase domain-containing protein [Gemmatimonadota bacterium]